MVFVFLAETATPQFYFISN